MKIPAIFRRTSAVAHESGPRQGGSIKRALLTAVRSVRNSGFSTSIAQATSRSSTPRSSIAHSVEGVSIHSEPIEGPHFSARQTRLGDIGTKLGKPREVNGEAGVGQFDMAARPSAAAQVQGQEAIALARSLAGRRDALYCAAFDWLAAASNPPQSHQKRKNFDDILRQTYSDAQLRKSAEWKPTVTEFLRLGDCMSLLLSGMKKEPEVTDMVVKLMCDGFAAKAGTLGDDMKYLAAMMPPAEHAGSGLPDSLVDRARGVDAELQRLTHSVAALKGALYGSLPDRVSEASKARIKKVNATIRALEAEAESIAKPAAAGLHSAGATATHTAATVARTISDSSTLGASGGLQARLFPTMRDYVATPSAT